MHDSSLYLGKLIATTYGGEGMKVLDVGGQNVNGSLRPFFEIMKSTYISMDMVAHPSVDVVVPPGTNFPFEDNYFDVIVSTSCFEHDPMFWVTFLEMARVVKQGGKVYINAPSQGPYHGYPGDNWRFYQNAGDALAYWTYCNSKDKSEKHILDVDENFILKAPPWNDNVSIYEKKPESHTIQFNPTAGIRKGPIHNILTTERKYV
jgi:SAM-dependent methyltransferase